MRKTHTILLALATLASSTASAQRLGLSVGYSRIPGRIGNLDSDEGIAVRAGFELNTRSIVRFGFEAGIDRLNESRRSYMQFFSVPRCRSWLFTDAFEKNASFRDSSSRDSVSPVTSVVQLFVGRPAYP